MGDIIVQKYGGSSVATTEKIITIAKRLIERKKTNPKIVVVVSAMGDTTDDYISLAKEITDTPDKRELDVLMSTGEMISASLLAMSLKSMGCDAISYNAYQLDIQTSGTHGKSLIDDIDVSKIEKSLDEGNIVVVTGFQGLDDIGDITTLGRGGSDTSAVALAVKLNGKCEIYTDVDGIMTADPRVVEDASLINEMTYNEVFQLADHGAKVIHPKAVEIAKRGNVPLVIKNTMSECKGTVIKSNVSEEEKRLISGITHLNNRIQVRVRLSENRDSKSYRSLLKLLAKNHISLDLINIFPEHQMFTIDSSEKEKLNEIMNKAGIKYSIIEGCSTIAIVGAGMNGVPGVMASIINTLTSNEIEVLQTTDSNMTIWCLIYTSKVKEAIRLLHKEFNLGNIN